MKKIFSMILILSTVLSITSCKYEEDDIWSQSAAERIESLSKSYAQTLMNSKGGWAMEYYPTNGNEYPSANGYLLMAKFNGDNTVSMGMKNDFSSSAYISDISTWDINRDQGPVLSFSSYNKCIHVFADPYDLPFTGDSQNDVNEEGKGAQGDYEFMMMEVPEDGDHVLLKGKKRGTYVRLTPVPEGTDFKTYIEECQQATVDFFPTTNSLEYTIIIPDSTISTYEFSSNMSTLYPLGTDRVMTGVVNPYMITKRDNTYFLRFRDVITLKDGTTMREFKYNKEEDIFRGVENESCIIDGPELASYVSNKLDDSKSWSIMFNSEMSDHYRAAYLALAIEFKNILNSELKNFSIRKADDKLCIRLTYGSGIRQQWLTFAIDNYTVADGKFSIGNVTADTENGKAILATKSFQAIIKALQEPNSITPATTKYNPNTLILTDDNDPETWWVTLTLI